LHREEQMMPRPVFDELAERLAAFARERDWEQFHSPKNLAMAISAEAAELLEQFQWLTEAQSRDLSAEAREAVALEMADVLLYLVRLADQLGVDLLDAAGRKLVINAGKYPVAKSRGNSRKYTEL
jgi:dCTP diphosphatase